MIVALMTGWLDRVVAVWLAAILMIGTRCVAGGQARSAINWQVLMTIGGALGLGAAVTASGLAEIAAGRFLDFVSIFGESPRLVLFASIIGPGVACGPTGADPFIYSLLRPLSIVRIAGLSAPLARLPRSLATERSKEKCQCQVHR
jgi:hypothetical protein